MTDAAGTRTGLIGRDEELRRLHAVLERDGAAVVTGEPGVGKTALLRSAARATDRRTFEGGGFATLAWRPYLALTLAAHVNPVGDPAWIADAVERAVGPDILLIDDLQDADAGTRSVLALLVGRVAVLTATRVDDDAGLAAASALVDAGAERIDLGPLPRDAARAMLTGIAADLPSGRTARVLDRSGGNPLLLEQLALGGESESLRRAVAARLTALGTDDRAGLALLALADRPLPLDALDGRADQLVERGFATRTPTGVEIRHALLAEAVRAETDPPTTAHLHDRLARLADDPGERARHLAAAGRRSAAHAAAIEAVASATSVGERAAHLGVAAATADGPEADRLRVDAAAELRVAGDLEGALSLLGALEGDDPETRARAAAVRARVHWSAGEPEAMRDAIAHGLDLVGGHGSPAESMLRTEAVVVTALVDGHFEDGLHDAAAAVTLAESTGADVTRPLLLRATLLAGLGLDGWDAALGAVVTAAQASGDAETELSATNNRIAGHEMHGDPTVARALALSMAERAHGLHLAAWERQAAAMLVNLDLHAGALADAVARGEALMEEPLDPLAAAQVGLAVACALVDQGQAETAGALIGRLLAAAPDDPVARLGILHIAAEHELWSGRPTVALRRVEEIRALDASDHPTAHLVDVVGAWAAADAESPLPARVATAEAEGMLAGAATERGAIDRLVAGDAVAAEAMFIAAAKAYAGVHRRGELRAGWAAAEARRRVGDLDGARAALDTLESAATAQGFLPLAGRIRRSLRLAGVRRSVATGGDGPGTPPESPGGRGPRLTPREREIVGLVAGGASNVEIARRLGLGRPTVARLLSSAMDKLGVDSRGQLAAHVDVR